MTAEPVHGLSRALDATDRVMAAVRDGQWEAPTPCPDWTARDLAGHLIAGNQAFASILRGERPVPPGGPPADVELVVAYRASVTPLLDAFRQPDVLEQVFTVPFGSVPGIVALHLRVTEVLVHGWDLARATNQPARFPEDLAEQELSFTRAKLADLPPDRHPFAPPQPVAEDAPAIDRLAACLGRKVSADAS